MDGMGRQNLIARKSVLVQEQDGSPCSGEECRERCTGAPSADDDDVVMRLCGHDRARAVDRLALCVPC